MLGEWGLKAAGTEGPGAEGGPGAQGSAPGAASEATLARRFPPFSPAAPDWPALAAAHSHWLQLRRPLLVCPPLVLGGKENRAGRCHHYGGRRGSGCAFRGAAPGSMEGGRRGEAPVAAAGDGPAPVFTLEEVAKRNSSREAWLVIHGRVYDVTRFLEEVRPGVGAARPGPAPGG